MNEFGRMHLLLEELRGLLDDEFIVPYVINPVGSDSLCTRIRVERYVDVTIPRELLRADSSDDAAMVIREALDDLADLLHASSKRALRAALEFEPDDGNKDDL